MIRSTFSIRLFLLSILLGSSIQPAASAEPATIALVHENRQHIEWTPVVEAESFFLAISDPLGRVRTYRFGAGKLPTLSLFDSKGVSLPDGTYTWELRAMRPLGANLERLVESDRRPAHPLVQSGYFSLVSGGLVDSDQAEPSEGRQLSGANTSVGPTDQIVPDDFIVDGKGCIGLGCNNNETFGPEAMRLKQSVVRLRFEDTSNQAGFPARDWQLVANDAASGGADRFSLDDLTAGTTPMTLRGGAPNNSLFVDGVGNVGLGTATPAQDLHVTSGNTPTVRLEQTAGTVRTWDVGANNASFFVKDVTNSSAVPFRIGAGAATGSLEIAGTGFVGLDTASPETRLHLRSTDPTTTSFGPSKLLVENASSTNKPRELFELRNNGSVAFIFEDVSVPERWAFQGFSNSFIIDNQNIGGIEYNFGPTGNLVITGNLTAANFPSSSRTLKEDFDEIDPVAVLNRLVSMPVTEWSFRGDPEHKRHIGPTVEDFQATFGLGTHGKSLVITDVGGVALASVQGLHALVEEQRRTIEKQQELIDLLEKRMQRLEAQDHSSEPNSTVQP